MATDPIQGQPWTIAEARAAIRAGHLSVTELVSAAVAAIERSNRQVNALITAVDPDILLAEARAMDAATLAQPRPLGGIPIVLKDNYATAGIRTTAGSRILSDWLPERDAEVVTRLRAAGAVIVGKANMHEFADGPTNDNPHWGRPLNPWDRKRTPGGSSGGSAVALTAGMCLGATGTDTGGSIRTPAAFCGIVGLKPTFGLVGRSGIVPFSPSLDHAGPMGRTVRDVAILLTAMGGYDPGDPGSADMPGRDYEIGLEEDVRGVLVGVEINYLSRVMQPAVRRVFERALHTLTDLGVILREVSIPILGASLAAETAVLFPEAYALHAGFLRTRLADYGPDVRASLLSGGLYSTTDYIRGHEVRRLIRHDLDVALKDVDLLVSPTVVIEPPRWGAMTFRIEGGSYDVLNAFIRCTAPFNLSGHPAISVPGEMTAHRLPVGIQLVGRRFAEPLLLKVAHALETAISGRASIARRTGLPVKSPDLV